MTTEEVEDKGAAGVGVPVINEHGRDDKNKGSAGREEESRGQNAKKDAKRTKKNRDASLVSNPKELTT